MRLSKITKSQWYSVVRNALFAGAAASIAVVAAGSDNKVIIIATGVMAAIKIVQKAFTPDEAN